MIQHSDSLRVMYYQHLTDQVSVQVTDQVARLLQALMPDEALKTSEVMQCSALEHRPSCQLLRCAL